jgi:dipeptidyl aminopeptidase/acylaminoacyl peptidase
VGREPKALPLIILPHGGPYGIRDVLEYNPEVQLLANRGYAVLQPNFRGSGGYGEDFERKGNGQMGRQMQDDLDDGMDWLVKSGTVDPQRVCMVGASYGGYAALWGATRNPERYRCAASLAGVTDLRQQLNYSDDFFMTSKNRRQWRERVQGPKGFDLESVSPLQQTSKLKVPILITHGTQDRTVPFKQAKSYVDKLAKEKKTFEFYEYKNEGHGLRSAANRADWFERLEEFLEKHNPSSGAVAAP